MSEVSRPPLTHSDVAPGLLLGPGVKLGSGVEIGANVVIHAETAVGDGVLIQDGAVVGKPVVLGPRSSAPRGGAGGAVIGVDACVLAGAIVFAGATLGRAAIAGDHSQVRERAVIGSGSVIGHGSSIDNDVTVGEGVRIQANCFIAGHSEIEDDVFVGPGVVTANDHTMGRHPPEVRSAAPRLRRACRIGAGAVICPGVEVGEEAYVGAGSVVTRTLSPRAVAMGVPAREVRAVPGDDLLEPDSR